MSTKNMIVIAVVIMSVIVISLVLRKTMPAEPAEIVQGLTAVPQECRDLTRARVMTHIATKGTLSRRQLEMTLSMDCKVAGEQYRAATSVR